MFKNIFALFAVILLVGCSTTKPSEYPTPLTDAQRAAMAKSARLPEIYGLTAYDSASGPVFTGGNRVHIGESAALAFASKEEIAPVVRLQNQDRKSLTALVDTTSRESWATVLGAAAMRIEFFGPPLIGRKAAHVFDEFGGFAGATHKLKLDEMSIESALFYTRNANGPLGSLARGLATLNPDLVFGTAFLRSCAFAQFDFAARELVLSASTPYTPDPERLIATVPLKDVQGAFACEGALDGAPTTFLLDTAGAFEIAMNNPPDGEITQISLGDLVFRRIQPADAKERGLGLLENPRIGLGLLSRYKVTFDLRRKLIHFERPAVEK